MYINTHILKKGFFSNFQCLLLSSGLFTCWLQKIDNVLVSKYLIPLNNLNTGTNIKFKASLRKASFPETCQHD